MTGKSKYLALLRAVNVGPKNRIKTDRLIALFQELNFSGVKTYIQSGNVIFDDPESNRAILTDKIEKRLFQEFNNGVKISLLTFREMEKIIVDKPPRYGEENEKYRYDMFFFINPLTAKNALIKMAEKEGVDQIIEGNKVLYYRILKERMMESALFKTMRTRLNENITIRNWKTTAKLYELMGGTGTNATN